MKLPFMLAPDVWRLGTYHLAVFLIRGTDGAALFEVGISATTPLVLSQIDALDIPREEVRWVITSHAHSDHATGAAGLLAGLPNAVHCLSAATKKHLAKDSTAELFVEEDVFTAGALADLGVQGLNGDAAPLPLLSDPEKLVEPGDELDLGGLSLQFMGAQGHVPGGLTALVPQRGLLMASDSAGFVMRKPPGFPMYFVSFGDYLDQMRGMLEMNLEVLAPGHQDWFFGPSINRYLKASMADLYRDHKAVLDGNKAGRTQEDLAREIYDDYYRDELTIYPPEAMLDSCRLLVRRSLEE